MIIIIDNYDSFTYNLYQYIGEINPAIEVYRNDGISMEEIRKKAPTHIVLSPGPGYPKDAGITKTVAKALGSEIPILGVCLGHQAIGEAYGGKVIPAGELMHGKASQVQLLKNCELFQGVEDSIQAGRYHSLVVERESLPEELEITAITGDGVIMGLKHRRFPLFGIQFHPESVLTPHGKKILDNFLKIG